VVLAGHVPACLGFPLIAAPSGLDLEYECKLLKIRLDLLCSARCQKKQIVLDSAADVPITSSPKSSQPTHSLRKPHEHDTAKSWESK
jgi:hypothetical protein